MHGNVEKIINNIFVMNSKFNTSYLIDLFRTEYVKRSKRTFEYGRQARRSIQIKYCSIDASH